MPEFDRRINELRGYLAALPSGPGPQRAEMSTRKGLLIADQHLRLRPDDHEPRPPASRAILDEGIDDLVIGGRRDSAVQIRLGLLHYVRYLACDGPVEDVEDAIGALRRAALAPDAELPDLALACLLIGHLLISRHLPKTLRADAAPDMASMAPLMQGFKLDTERGVPDIREAVAFLDDEAASDFWPDSVRASARMMARVGRLLITDDWATQLTILGELMSDAEGLKVMGQPEDGWMSALGAWAGLEKAQLSGSPEERRAAIGRADTAFWELDEDDFMLGPLGRELGLAAIDSTDGLETALRYLTRAEAATGEDHPYFDILRTVFGGAFLTAVADNPWRGDGEGFPDVDRAVEIAQGIVTDRRRSGIAEDDVQLARDEFFLAMALLLRSIRDGGDEGRKEGMALLGTALTRLPDDDALAPAASAVFGAMLSDVNLTHGSLQHAEAARVFLAKARALLGDRSDETPHAVAMRAHMAVALAQEAWERQDTTALAAARKEIVWAAETLPQDYPWRARLATNLAVIRLHLGQINGDGDEIRQGLDDLVEAGAAPLQDTDRTAHQGLSAVAAVASFLRGLMIGDTAQIDSSVALLERAVAGETFARAHRVPLLTGLAMVRLARPDDLDAGISHAQEALALMDPELGESFAAPLLSTLAEGLRRRDGDGDREQAVEIGLRALKARVRDVLAQVGAEDGLIKARESGGFAQQVALWCLEAGRNAAAVEALELGRGLVLHAATSFTSIPDLLRAAGEGELAAELSSRPPAPLVSDRQGGPAADLLLQAMTGGEMASDLQRRALTVLRSRPEVDRLFVAPSPQELGSALTAAGADALVYLLTGAEHGWLLVIGRDGDPQAVPLPGLGENRLGPLGEYAEAREHQEIDPQRYADALSRLCDWAWPELMEIVLARCAPLAADGEPRIVLVPGGSLGLVSWHAARRDHRYLCDDAVVSYAASGRQFVNATSAKPAADPRTVLIADPDDSKATSALPHAVTEVEALHGTFYPDAVLFGEGQERATVTAVREAFRDATLVHCASHAEALPRPGDSAILLARDEEDPDGRLRLATLLDDPDSCRSCALLVLSACVSDLTSAVYDEALTLSTAFQAAGVAEVIGSRWLVSDTTTAVMMFVFHRELDRGLDAADALRAAQRWMADPRRDLSVLPNDLYALATKTVWPLEHPITWAAFTHQGVPVRREAGGA